MVMCEVKTRHRLRQPLFSHLIPSHGVTVYLKIRPNMKSIYMYTRQPVLLFGLGVQREPQSY